MFYRNDVNLALSSAPDTLEAAMLQRHLPLPVLKSYETELNALCR